MAREFRVVFYLGGEINLTLAFRGFRSARDFAENEVKRLHEEPDFCLTVEQRRAEDWERMLSYGPAAPGPMASDVHVSCVLCYAQFRVSPDTLIDKRAYCPHCGASFLLKEV